VKLKKFHIDITSAVALHIDGDTMEIVAGGQTYTLTRRELYELAKAAKVVHDLTYPPVDPEELLA
jgi:hypothetical protein